MYVFHLFVTIMCIISDFLILLPNFVVNVLYGFLFLHNSGLCAELEIFKNDAIIVCNIEKTEIT